MLVFSGNLGMFVAFVAGAYLRYETVPWVFIPISVFVFVGFLYLPDTPVHLMRNKQISVSIVSI